MPPLPRMAAACPHQLSGGAQESVDYAWHKGAVQTKGVGQASQVGVGHALRWWGGSTMVGLMAGRGRAGRQRGLNSRAGGQVWHACTCGGQVAAARAVALRTWGMTMAAVDMPAATSHCGVK